MAEAQMAVASAVIVPETEEQPLSPMNSAKRRLSSFSDEISKRPKLGQEPSYDQAGDPLQSTGQTRQSDRRRSGQLEERKRGQRLFGALLGTLSQSSSSTAQKRRTDIEKKQQAKLKLQEEEYDEQKKQRLESLMEIRRTEQKKYDKKSMHIRHSNLLAQAHFLQTKSEPKLYYKPWELLPREEASIKSQIEEAEATIQQETTQLESPVIDLATNANVLPETETNEFKADQAVKSPKETVGADTNTADTPSGPSADNDTNRQTDTTAVLDTLQESAVQQEVSKEHDDDGGEMVEAGDEDMVIY